MMYNMYDVVLPTYLGAGGGTRGTAVLMMTGLLVQAHRSSQVCVLATQLKLLYLPHILTRCGSTKHLHFHNYSNKPV